MFFFYWGLKPFVRGPGHGCCYSHFGISRQHVTLFEDIYCVRSAFSLIIQSMWKFLKWKDSASGVYTVLPLISLPLYSMPESSKLSGP